MPCLAAYVLVRYGDSVLSFLFLDDFWILRDATRVHWSLEGVAQLFRFNHMGFELYRPLTQTVYFFLLHAAFGTDTSGYHLVQLAFFALNAVLALAIATRLTESRLAGFAIALLYAAAPGHAVAVFWVAAFTMIGTTVAVFLMILSWQTSAWPTRMVTVTLLQIVALLCSEHAVAAPVLLVCIAAFSPRRERWWTVLRDVSGAVLAVVAYVGLKLAYFSLVQWPGGSYQMSAAPLNVLANIGSSASATLNVLTLLRPSRLAVVFLGGALLVVAGVATVLALRGRKRWRLLACGLDFFLIACLPVAPLTNHFYEYLVGIAALGMATAVVGALSLLAPWRSVPPLALGVALLVVGVDAATKDAAIQNSTFELYVEASRTGEIILMNLGRVRDTYGPWIRVIVPRDPGTALLVETGEVGRVFFSPPMNVKVSPPAVPQPDRPYAYLNPPDVPLFTNELPFWWNPRFDWIRQTVPVPHSWYVHLLGAGSHEASPDPPPA